MAQDKDDIFGGQLEDLLKELRELPGNMERGALKKAIEEAAVIMAAGVSQEAPMSDAPHTAKSKSRHVTYLPGFLKGSVMALRPRARRHTVSVGIGAAYYARWVEKGHTIVRKDKNGKKRVVAHVPANNFIQRAFEANKEWALDVARRIFVEELDKRVRRLQRRMRKKSGG